MTFGGGGVPVVSISRVMAMDPLSLLVANFFHGLDVLLPDWDLGNFPLTSLSLLMQCSGFNTAVKNAH